MSRAEPVSTVVSTKGQVILPKRLRERLAWTAGTRLVVEDVPEGVLLRRAPDFPASQPSAVFGLLPHAGAAKSLEEMDAAVLAEARRRAGD